MTSYDTHLSMLFLPAKQALSIVIELDKIREYLHYNKSELIDVLIKRGLLPETINTTAITSLPERKIPRKKYILNITFENTYAIVHRRLRSEILIRMKLLYILLCLRLLRHLINIQD